MTKTRGALYAVLAGAVALLLWTRQHAHDRKVDASIRATTLPAGDSERIVFSPGRHEIETISRIPLTGKIEIKRRFVSSSGASVDIRRDGSVQVNSRTWGTALHPFVGLALGSDIVGRAALGLDVFYWQRWELGGGLLVDSRINDTRVFAAVNYNVYDNVLVGGAVDNKHTVHILASLKF